MKRFGNVGFMHCVLTVTAVVMGLTLLFSKEAPMKKISAKLECSYESADSVRFLYPGNGTKVKPRIDGAINCWISIPKIPSGATLMGKIWAKGKVQEAEAIPRPDNTYSADASFSPGNEDFETCSAFVVTGELIRSGKIIWKGRLIIDQSCHD